MQSIDNIEELLRKMGVSKIQHTGRNINSTCPFYFKHSDGKDTNPSFSVETSSPYRAVCGGCQTRGTIFSLAKKYYDETGVSIIEEKKRDSSKFEWKAGVRVFNRNDEMYLTQVSFHWEDFTKYCKQLPQYALDRGITIPQAKKWKLGFNPDSKKLFIPVFNRLGVFVGYSERDVTGFSDRKYKHATGFRRNLYLYGEQFMDKEMPIAFLSEGFFDVWSLERAGLTNCFAAMGTVPSKDQIEFLCQFETIVIFPHQDKVQPDGTTPGMRMAEAFRKELDNRYKTVIIAPFYKDYKDVGDWPIEAVKEVVSDILKDL